MESYIQIPGHSEILFLCSAVSGLVLLCDLLMVIGKAWNHVFYNILRDYRINPTIHKTCKPRFQIYSDYDWENLYCGSQAINYVVSENIV